MNAEINGWRSWRRAVEPYAWDVVVIGSFRLALKGVVWSSTRY